MYRYSSYYKAVDDAIGNPSGRPTMRFLIDKE